MQQEQPSARETLRDFTASGHAALDAHPVAKLLAEGTPLELSDYTLILIAYHRWFAAWEAGFLRDHARTAEALGAERFLKAAWLQEDLTALPSVQIDVPLVPPPAAANPAEAAGALYVVEGSTLGGRHILRRLNLNPPLPPGSSGTRFFNGYGSDTSNQWNNLIEWIESALPDSAARGKAGLHARELFASFEALFDQVATQILSPSSGPPSR